MGKAITTFTPPKRRIAARVMLLPLTMLLVTMWGISLVWSIHYFMPKRVTFSDGQTQEWRCTFVGLERGNILCGVSEGFRPGGLRVGLPAGGVAWMPWFSGASNGWAFAWPLWTIALPALAWTIASCWPRRKLPPTACPACGYDLRASKDKCPECGTEVLNPSPPMASTTD